MPIGGGRGIVLRQRVVERLNPRISSAGFLGTATFGAASSAALQVGDDFAQNPCRRPSEFVSRAGVAAGFGLVHAGAGALGARAGFLLGAGASPAGAVVGGVAGGVGGATLSMLALEAFVPSSLGFPSDKTAKEWVLYQISPSEHTP